MSSSHNPLRQRSSIAGAIRPRQLIVPPRNILPNQRRPAQLNAVKAPPRAPSPHQPASGSSTDHPFIHFAPVHQREPGPTTFPSFDPNEALPSYDSKTLADLFGSAPPVPQLADFGFEYGWGLDGVDPSFLGLSSLVFDAPEAVSPETEYDTEANIERQYASRLSAAASTQGTSTAAAQAQAIFDSLQGPFKSAAGLMTTPHCNATTTLPMATLANPPM
ncbi:hypothetical protein OC835_005122, partial [Tilletia horrida]